MLKCAQHIIDNTLTNLLDIVNRIQGNMYKGMFSCGVFVDLQKALDTVDHHIALQKLSHYGIRGIINNCFFSYFKRKEPNHLWLLYFQKIEILFWCSTGFGVVSFVVPYLYK